MSRKEHYNLFKIWVEDQQASKCYSELVLSGRSFVKYALKYC